MAIIRKYQPPLDMLGRFAFTVGKAQAARQAESRYLEQAQRMAYAQRQHENAMKEAQFQADLDMQIRMRSAQWDFEKVQMQAMNTFQMQEEARRVKFMLEQAKEAKKDAEYQAVIDRINKEVPPHPDLSADLKAQRNQLLFRAFLERYGYEGILPSHPRPLTAKQQWEELTYGPMLSRVPPAAGATAGLAGGGAMMDAQTASDILSEAGNNPEKAAQIARSRGYIL